MKKTIFTIAMLLVAVMASANEVTTIESSASETVQCDKCKKDGDKKCDKDKKDDKKHCDKCKKDDKKHCDKCKKDDKKHCDKCKKDDKKHCDKNNKPSGGMKADANTGATKKK